MAAGNQAAGESGVHGPRGAVNRNFQEAIEIHVEAYPFRVERFASCQPLVTVDLTEVNITPRIFHAKPQSGMFSG
jgi:hypothetical protein